MFIQIYTLEGLKAFGVFLRNTLNTESFISVQCVHGSTMVDVTDIKGIGPAKAETLDDHGYSSLEDIATADQDTLGDVDGVGGDRALEFIVGANDLLEDEGEELEDEQGESEGDEFDLTPSEVSDEVDEVLDEEEDELTDDSPDESDVKADTTSEDESTESDDDEDVYSVNLSFASRREYDTFHASLMRRHEDVFSGNQPAADALENCLEQLDDRTSVEYELTEYELNTLHTAVKQARTEYQGRNLIDHMDALKEVEAQVDEQRRELLF